jgi:hypothetical protein
MFVPSRSAKTTEPEPEGAAEAIAFDKAEEAESTERLHTRHDELHAQIEEHKRLLKEASGDDERERISRQINQLSSARQRMADQLQERAQEQR